MKRCRGRTIGPLKRAPYFEQTEEEQEIQFADPLSPQMHETKRFKRYLKISSVPRLPS